MSDLGANEPPHSMSASSPAAAAAVARGRVAQPNGWWGMVLFLCSEATIFGSLIGTYYYLDFRVAHWPPTGVELPRVTAAAIATGALAATAPMLWAAVRACRRALRRPAMAWITFALAVQAAYIGVQVVLYRDDLMHFSPRGSAYGSIYFTVLAADHAHVILGLLLDLALLWKLWRHGLDNYWLIGARGLALYWYVVIAVTVLVLLTVLTPSL